MHTRRWFVTRSVAGMLGTAGLCLGVSGDEAGPLGEGEGQDRLPDGSASKGMITTRTEQAIQRGLFFLNAHKTRNGSLGTGQYSGNVAISSLAAMAAMCAGSQPGRGTYGQFVLDALRYVLSKENVDVGGRFPGYLFQPNSGHGPMYGHGFATLFLSEVYGMVHEKQLRDEVREKLHRAVKLILKSQNRNRQGAWRYLPDSGDADLSVTVCQMMALRSARNTGILVPKSAIDLSTAYVKACQDLMEGWFRYQKQGNGGGGVQGFARTAAGVCALNAAGIYNTPEVKAGLEFLLRNKPGNGFGRPDIHYFYGHYYAVQAMWTAGGNYWQEWFPAIRDELLARQNPDGSWLDQICGHYATSMACIILQVPNNYLPILQK
jgi:hypothetical protein